MTVGVIQFLPWISDGIPDSIRRCLKYSGDYNIPFLVPTFGHWVASIWKRRPRRGTRDRVWKSIETEVLVSIVVREGSEVRCHLRTSYCVCKEVLKNPITLGNDIDIGVNAAIQQRRQTVA